MSTYLYLECLDHDPPLRAEDESGQHLYDLPRIRDEITRRDELATAYLDHTLPTYNLDDDNLDRYFQQHSAQFLAAHPTCRIGIRDEYDRAYPVTAAGEEPQ